MSRLDRKLLINSLLLGAALTVIVAILQLTNALGQAEVWLYDRRARLCQHFTPPPTSDLIHLDIDDASLDAIGRWPWDRRIWAELLDEVRLANPKAIELDFIFPEPQQLRQKKLSDGSFVEVDEDALFAAAIGRAGNVILASSFDVPPPESAQFHDLVAKLTADPHLDRKQLAGVMTADPKWIADRYTEARTHAVRDRVETELARGTAPAKIRDAILGAHAATEDLHTPLEAIVASQIEFALAAGALKRFGAPIPGDFPPSSTWVPERAPIHALSDRAAGAAFVDYPAFEDGVTRSVPLLIECDGVVQGQMGLVLACRMLDTPLSAVRVEGDTVVVPRKGQAELRIPVVRVRTDSEGRRRALLMDLPWFGGREWLDMYDYPTHSQPRQHISAVTVWQAIETRKNIDNNLLAGRDAMRVVYGEHDLSKLPTAPNDLIAEFQAAVDDKAVLWSEILSAQDRASLSDSERQQVAAIHALKNVIAQDSELRAQLKVLESQLSVMKGRAVLAGFTATAVLADVVPTSLHDRCPGVIIHGVVFNGIMTGDLWKRSPAWVGVAIVLALGGLTALATGWLSPMSSAIVAALLGLGYALVNGYLLFDYGNLIVPAAGPLLVVAAVWGGCAVWKALVESNERHRITARFQNYVEPDLVNYYLEHPEELGLKGTMREMTVVFTDLAGFTTISEQLGPQIVELLNEYMGLMVPIIRRHGGYVNKFLGDGIMFFFGAPRQSAHHARDAVVTVLEMQKTVAEFNEILRKRGLLPVKMRAGILAGEMSVGDAGSLGEHAEKRDYTAIGNTVNLASRLEGANKATGTLTLVSSRAAELVGDQFLLRPVGALQVVGKTEGERAFEVICAMSEANDAQKKLVAITRQMIDAFSAGRFADCIELCEQLDSTRDSSRLGEMYRSLCVQYLRDPPATFSGVVVLTEK